MTKVLSDTEMAKLVWDGRGLNAARRHASPTMEVAVLFGEQAKSGWLSKSPAGKWILSEAVVVHTPEDVGSLRWRGPATGRPVLPDNDE